MNQGDQDDETNQGSTLSPQAVSFNPYGPELMEAYRAYQRELQSKLENYADLFLPVLHHAFLLDRRYGHEEHFHAFSSPVHEADLGPGNAHHLSAPYIWSVFASLTSAPNLH